MKRIVFFCIPAHGHTNPTLGVVRELVNRGHQVWYYSYEMFRNKIESTGAHFIPCDGHDMELKLTPGEASRLGNDMVLSTRVLVDTTLSLDEMVCRDMQNLHPDCIVADSMAVWGKAVAQKLGIPFVSSTTTFAFNKHSAKVMPQSLGELFRFLITMPRCSRHIKRLQMKGYPVKNVLDILQNDENTHTIVYTSEEFQPCSETFSKEYYSFVGPSVRPAESVVEKQQEKLIYISMGTVNNDMLPFYRVCIHAFADKDYQVIISVGNQVNVEQFGALPENIKVYSSVDQIAVLQKADVFLTHCGMNSVSEALYFGVPLVMHPITSEQKGVANRVSQMEAGVFLEKETRDAVWSAVNCVLQTPYYAGNARKIGQGFHNCAGASAAADKILEVCR